MHDDPLIFALRARYGLACAARVVVTLVTAR